MRIYQLEYVVITTTYKVKHYLNSKSIAIFAHPASATGGIPVRIYTQTHRRGILKGDIMSHIQRKTLDTPCFLGITAEQEQVVKLFKLKLIKK